MKSHTRLLVSLLLISTIASATGCSKKNETYGKEAEPIVFGYQQQVEVSLDIAEVDNQYGLAYSAPFEEVALESNPAIAENVLEPCEVSSDIEINIEKLLKEYLYDENINYKLVIKQYLNNYEQREQLKNDYLRSIYMLLVNSNVPMETYLKELHTVALMQQIPMCVSDEVWNASFSNLIKVDPDCLSLFDMFSEFAIYVHTLECEEEHKLNQFDCYTCPSLEEEYTRKLTINNI